jgi:hypothetical protein
MATRERMIKYLLRETRLTISQLNALSDEKLTRYYKEERECNHDKNVQGKILL